MNKITTIAVAAAVAALAFFSSSVKAQTLDLSGGKLVNDLLSQQMLGVFPSNVINQVSGTINTWVVNDAQLDSQGLTFIYQVQNTGIDTIDQVELTGFSSGIVVGTGTYSSLTGSLALPDALTPGAAGNFTYEANGATTATFEDGEFPNTGVPSYFLVVYTSSSLDGPSYGQIQDDFSALGNILAPVPEPSTWALFGIGALVLGTFGYRRTIKT